MIEAVARIRGFQVFSHGWDYALNIMTTRVMFGEYCFSVGKRQDDVII